MIIVSIFCTNDLDFCTNVVNTALNFENAREGRASIVHRAIQLILKRVNSYCDHRYYERIALYDRHGPNPPEEAAGPSTASLHAPTYLIRPQQTIGSGSGYWPALVSRAVCRCPPWANIAQLSSRSAQIASLVACVMRGEHMFTAGPCDLRGFTRAGNYAVVE